VDHFVPLFIALGASLESGAEATTPIDGFWFGNSKRSFELG
jgi:4,5-DOPA dioxygenase extradiol